MFGAWPDKFEQRYDHIVSAYVFYEFKLDEKIRLLQRLAKNNLVSDGYFVIGDISFVTSASQNKMREDVGDLWDDDEYYWVAEEAVGLCQKKGFDVEYEQVSSCGGIYVVRPKSA